jgi:2'-5' RNA ligase
MGMGCCNGGETGVNSFALVSYLPDPLAGFLDRLRAELVPGCHSKAHVTLLPPRPLMCPSEAAWSEIERKLRDVPPFRVELAEIEVFPVTQVIYISVNAGNAELRQLHRILNVGSCAFEEPFDYHPHVTLAQDLEPDQLPEAIETARKRWREFPGARSFSVEKLAFVQNSIENRWTDLSTHPLKPRIHADAR